MVRCVNVKDFEGNNKKVKTKRGLTVLSPTRLPIMLWFFQLTLLLGGAVVVQALGPNPIRNATMADRLRQDLLLNYDKLARPTQFFNTTPVQFGMSLHHIDVDELTSTFTVQCYTRLVWTDDKLKWVPSDYENITSVHLHVHEIWQPDIVLSNSAASQTIGNYLNIQTIVEDNGEVLWVPPEQFTAFCNINLRYWPFDQQTCYMKFESYVYHGGQINLTLYSTDVDSTDILSNNEWELVGSTIERNLVYYPCCLEPYPEITLNITVARISESYQAIVIAPAFSIIVVILMTFWLPPQAGEKIILQGCTVIIICMFLLYFAQKLPAMRCNTPLIVLFYSTSLYVVCFSLMGSIAVIRLSRTPHPLNLPSKLKRTLTGWLGKRLWLGHYIAQTNNNTNRVTTEEMRDHQGNSDMGDSLIIDRNVSQARLNDWVLLAAAIDRLSFCGYLVLFAFMTIGYSL